MKPDIEYVYNALKKLRFDFKESDRKLFPNEYTFDYSLDRYVRVDGNDLYISKDTFKPLEEELEYAEKCHNLEEELGCPLEVYVGINRCDIINVYDKNGIEYTIGYSTINKNSFMAINGFTLIDCKWNMYCKTWWLKKEKSE